MSEVKGVSMTNDEAFNKFLEQAFKLIKARMPDVVSEDAKELCGLLCICAAIVRRDIKDKAQISADPIAIMSMFMLNSFGITGEDVLKGFGRTWIEDVAHVAVLAPTKAGSDSN